MTEAVLDEIPKAGARIGPWVVRGQLGRGGMAVVLDVEHVEDGQRRALKLALSGGREEELKRRFQREYRVLSSLKHPGVLQVHSWDSCEGRPYFVMERLDGRELRDELELWQSLPPAERFRRAEDVLVRLARSMQYIHQRGWVHRDVSPSNIMMLADGGVKLMDFGVVKEPGAELTRVGEVVGTVAWIAPEQIQGTLVDARADLYSLGAVLYLMLTGRRPFNARSLAGYLDKHLHRPPRPPRELAPTLPEHLDRVCMRLLEKAPADRYASATHLLYVLDPREGADRANVRGFVGRAAELFRVREAVARLSDGRGGVLRIEASPGMGRARMADRVIAMAQEAGVAVTRSRSTSPQQPPYQGFLELYRDLARSGEDRPALEATYAGLGRAPERLAVLGAFKELVADIAPRVVLLEDIHLADRGTIELLAYLGRFLDVTSPVLLVPVAERSAEAASEQVDRPAKGGLPWTEIELLALTRSAVEEMLLELVRYDPRVPHLAERLHGASRGNPALLAEILRDLVQEGVLLPGNGQVRGSVVGNRAELTALRLPVPGTIRERIELRLDAVSGDAHRVGAALAVARDEVGPDLLLEVLAFDDDRLFVAVDELIEAGLVRAREVADDERYELARHRLGDVLLDRLEATERRLLHRRIGTWLERHHRRATGAVVESLALHFEQGEVPGKALRYLVESGQKLIDRAFVDEAFAFLERAAVVAPAAREHLTLDDADRWMAWLHLAQSQALVHRGDWDAAEAAAAEADRLATEVGEATLLAHTATERAVQARRVRRLEEAEAHLQRALAHASEARDPRLEVLPYYESGAVSWARGDLDGARDDFLRALSSAEASHDERSLAVAYNGLGILSFCNGQSAEARRNFDRAIEISERELLLERLLICRTNLVELFHVTGNLRKGLELADRTVAHAREVAHPFGLAVGLRYRVLMLTDLRRLVEAEEHAHEAIRIQRSLHNPEEELATRVMLTRVYLAGGDYERAKGEQARVEGLLPEFDSEGFGPVVRAWRARLLAEDGDLDGARAALAHAVPLPSHAWPHQLARLGLNVARALAVLGEREKAFSRAEDALQISDRCGFRYYAMRARQLCARLGSDEALVKRHQRVAEALARSLAANLPREDAARFLAGQRVPVRGGAGRRDGRPD